MFKIQNQTHVKKISPIAFHAQNISLVLFHVLKLSPIAFHVQKKSPKKLHSIFIINGQVQEIVQTAATH